jgi:CYTH domain-containing protein
MAGMMAQVPKYALLEHERRFLVRECPDLSGASYRQIEDLYVADGRLRLRAISPSDGAQRVFKLCKKYPSDDPLSGAIVNIYLTAEEHAALSLLPGRRLRKKRYRLDQPRLDQLAAALSLDVFEGPLAGLILGEAEAESAAALGAFDLPRWAAREVTGDPFFRGGNLVRIGAAALRAKLAEPDR